MSVATHSDERETGHTGNFFNIQWAMPGVALSGPQASGAWMREYSWYYDLARRWDGSFVHQGLPKIKQMLIETGIQQVLWPWLTRKA